MAGKLPGSGEQQLETAANTAYYPEGERSNPLPDVPSRD